MYSPKLSFESFVRIILVLAVFILATAVSGAVSQKSMERDCTSESELRIANILGCCGDVQQSYHGTELQRMTAALDEITVTLHKGCLNQNSSEYLEILLDQSGAYLARARARISDEHEPREVIFASNDVAKSVAILREFTQKHPKESSLAWYWVATALQKAGQPWMALEFISTLDPHCCKKDQLDEFRGELLFELGIYDAASVAYSAWLSRSSDYYCGHSSSLSHVDILRHHGFSIPKVDEGPQDSCFVMSNWIPYVRFPRK